MKDDGVMKWAWTALDWLQLDFRTGMISFCIGFMMDGWMDHASLFLLPTHVEKTVCKCCYSVVETSIHQGR